MGKDARKGADTKKRIARHMHAKTRASERYQADLNKNDLYVITSIIRAGNADLIAKQPESRKVFRVTYLDKTYYAVYHVADKSILTFLPSEWIVGPKEMAGMESMIKDSKAILLRSITPHRLVSRIHYQGYIYDAVFNTKKEIIVRFLTHGIVVDKSLGRS